MQELIALASKALSYVLHIDQKLEAVLQEYQSGTYFILFAIIFCETGLVATPFLPGDSLLFAAGALTRDGGLNIHLLAALLLVAAILGDAVNYAVGSYIGPRVFEKKGSRIFRPEYLLRTQKFFEKYGGKAIIFARFVPIVRTFAPFLAGVGTMSYRRFALYNVTGAILWVGLFLYGGYLLGQVELVKKNFSIVILAIIVISVLPAVVEVIKARRENRIQGVGA